MTLMYWREYRTESHIAQSYGVSEATVCPTIRKLEDVLVRSKRFRLPGKKALQPSDTVVEGFSYPERTLSQSENPSCLAVQLDRCHLQP
jgi:hypothetical protein